MRMFVAVVPPEHVVEDLAEFLSPRWDDPDVGGALRWTVPEQWHVTLGFSADLPDRSYDDLVDRLTRAARKRRQIEARIAGGGAFPHAGKAKLVYAGISTDLEELSRMATGARAAIARAGAGVDGQRFRPHLTLARTRHPGEVSDWVRLLDGYRGPTWRVEDVVLVASYLHEGPRNRPRHEVRRDVQPRPR